MSGNFSPELARRPYKPPYSRKSLILKLSRCSQSLLFSLVSRPTKCIIGGEILLHWRATPAQRYKNLTAIVRTSDRGRRSGRWCRRWCRICPKCIGDNWTRRRISLFQKYISDVAFCFFFAELGPPLHSCLFFSRHAFRQTNTVTQQLCTSSLFLLCFSRVYLIWVGLLLLLLIFSCFRMGLFTLWPRAGFFRSASYDVSIQIITLFIYH